MFPVHLRPILCRHCTDWLYPIHSTCVIHTYTHTHFCPSYTTCPAYPRKHFTHATTHTHHNFYTLFGRLPVLHRTRHRVLLVTDLPTVGFLLLLHILPVQMTTTHYCFLRLHTCFYKTVFNLHLYHRAHTEHLIPYHHHAFVLLHLQGHFSFALISLSDPYESDTLGPAHFITHIYTHYHHHFCLDRTYCSHLYSSHLPAFVLPAALRIADACIAACTHWFLPLFLHLPAANRFYLSCVPFWFHPMHTVLPGFFPTWFPAPCTAHLRVRHHLVCSPVYYCRFCLPFFAVALFYRCCASVHHCLRTFI